MQEKVEEKSHSDESAPKEEEQGAPEPQVEPTGETLKPEEQPEEEKAPEPVQEAPKKEPEQKAKPEQKPHHHAKEHHRKEHKEHARPKTSFKDTIKNIYEKEYKKLLIIPFLILVLAFAQMGYQYATTGDFINRGVTLKGGISLTIPTDAEFVPKELQQSLQSQFAELDINVRELSSAGSVGGAIVEADVDITDDEKIQQLVDATANTLGLELGDDDYTIEGIGSSLGESFFREAAIAMLVAFLFMGVVVFIYFRNLGPSLAVILAAFSDIIVTVAVINIMGMKMSTSGIVALLLLIGYSVDTDILLSTRVLRSKEGSIMERIYSAMKTGLTMTASTGAAVIVALIFTQSIVIKQIMIILLVGLIIDIINTYIQNVGLLRWFVEK